MSPRKGPKQWYRDFREDRTAWKNPSRKFSKLSDYRIEKILDCFVRDLSVAEAWQELSPWRKKKQISEKTIRIKYREIQTMFVRGGLQYPEMYGGALMPLLVGIPPYPIQERIFRALRADPSGEGEDDQEVGKYRIRPNKNGSQHFDDVPHMTPWFERALREYAWLDIDPLSQLVIFDFASTKFSRIYDPAGIKEFWKFGIDYIAEANWVAGKKDVGLRDIDLWRRIYRFPWRSPEGYRDRLFRDMKWIIKQASVGHQP